MKILTLAMLILGLLNFRSMPDPAKPFAERFWLAGRYDGNQIIVYFDAVKFGNTFPGRPENELTEPVVFGFFSPAAITASYMASLRRQPGAEQFAVGDHYDLLLGGNEVATATLTKLVGYAGDEEVGNDSYIGALGTAEHGTELSVQGANYYVLTRHHDMGTGSSGLAKEPVSLDIQAKAVGMLTARMKTEAPAALRMEIGNAAPVFRMQAFTLADGSLRYYARAQWNLPGRPNGRPTYALAGWMSALPALRILAVEDQTSTYGFDESFPNLLNVINLGKAGTGLVVSISGEDSSALKLLVYRDGLAQRQMRILQSIKAGE